MFHTYWFAGLMTVVTFFRVVFVKKTLIVRQMSARLLTVMVIDCIL